MVKFPDVYDEYARQVFRFLLSLTRDAGMAEELTQETFYKAFLHIEQFEGKCSMFTWLCQIARNTYLNELKKKKHVSDYLGQAEAEDPKDFVDSLLDREKVLEVHRVLHGLSEPYKEVFSLRVFGELKYRDIAEIFGKTEVWAKVTFYRAKERIIEQMERKE